MGIGDNFDTSVPGLINQRTGRASGHSMLGQDDNGGHPCNVGCGCKPVCAEGIDGGSCLLPPEFRISILQLPDLCKDSNNSGVKTDDETPKDCEENNGTCLDSEGKVKLDKNGEDYADKKSCETEEGKWETSGTWEKSSRKLARGYESQQTGDRETFWLRYQNGSWKGRKCCGKSSYDDAGKKLWDMDSDQCDPCDITTFINGDPSWDACNYYGKEGTTNPGVGESNRPYIDKNSPLSQKYTLGHKVTGQFSLQDLLIEWWGDENPYQPSLSVERQHLAHIFRMGSVGAGGVIEIVGNPFYSHYENIIAAGKEQCLPDGERFPRINGCMDTDNDLVTIPWQVCYKSSCTQSEYTTKDKCEKEGGEWNLFVIDDSHAGDNGHETACKDAGYDLYKADIYLDEQQCYDQAKCLDSEGEEVKDSNGDPIRSKWICFEQGSPPDDYGKAGVKNKWTQEWELLDTEGSEAMVSTQIRGSAPLGVGSDTCCGGQGISDTSPPWVSEIKSGHDDVKAQQQNTCITPYKEVTLVPRISSGVMEGCSASTSPWQRTEEGYEDIANSGFTLIIKDCNYWGNCYDSSDEGTGEVTILHIPMDQIMNCTNFRKTGSEWKDQFGWWGNPVGFYPGDPQVDVDIVEQSDGTMSVSPLGGTHLNWCYISDDNNNGQADWNESNSGTKKAGGHRSRFKLKAAGDHFAGADIDYDHGDCSVALYWENILALKPHNARSHHAPGDYALRKLNLQKQPFKATEKKQNSYKSLSEAKADMDAFNNCINGSFGSFCPWTGLAYWFEHDFVAWDDKDACKEAGEALKRYTQGTQGRIDCSALLSGRPERTAIWNIYDDPIKYTDGEQSIEPGTPQAMEEGNVWNMNHNVLQIINNPRLIVSNVEQNLDYWGRTGIYPDASSPSYVVETCKGTNAIKSIEYASNTMPIVVRSNRHGLKDGDHVVPRGVQGNFKANVMTAGEWMETQWDTKLSSLCPESSDCERITNPGIICPCNDGNTYGKDNEHCSGVIIKGEYPDPAGFFVAKVINGDEYALYTCDGVPADGTVDIVPVGGDSEDCDREKPGERICVSIFSTPTEVPTAQVEVVTGSNGLPIIQTKSPITNIEDKATCVEHVNCAVVNPPYDNKWSVMTKPECERLRTSYDGIEVDGNGVTYRPLSPSSRTAECGDECFYPLTWMRKQDFKVLTGENVGPGATSWPACAYTGEWTLDFDTSFSGIGTSGGIGISNTSDYRTGWTGTFKEDSSKAQDYYVWMHNEETCPACCDHFLPNTLYATVTGDRDQGGSTELYDFMLSGEIATTLHNRAGDKCSDNSGDDEANCQAEWIRGKLETTVPCGINKCTGEMHDHVLNYWGLPVGGRYCCDCGTYPAPLGGHGPWHQKCFDCGNALRFDDPRWPDQVTKNAEEAGTQESGKGGDDFCCNCDCNPGADHGVSDDNNLLYPTADTVIKLSQDGCTNTIGNLSCAYETFGESCELKASITNCFDIENQADCIATGPNGQVSGCEWADVSGMGETCNEVSGLHLNNYCSEYTSSTCATNARCAMSEGFQQCICGDFYKVPCFGFPNGRPMECETEIVYGASPGCPNTARGNWTGEVWRNPLAQLNKFGTKGCGIPNTAALPTSDCYDFLPLDGQDNTGGKRDYKDGCHGMSPKTMRMDHNGSHWSSNWEPMMGDSPRTKNLDSGPSYKAFVGGMSCEHYSTHPKCLFSTCTGGRSDSINCNDQTSCEGKGKDQCKGTWVTVNEWQPGTTLSGGPDMSKNCGDCATNHWSAFGEPPVPTPQYDAHLMRLKMGCGEAFNLYPARGTMPTGDYYRNNQLSMFLEVTHCSYTTCNPLNVVEAFNPPCPNQFSAPALRDGTIISGGSYSVGINTEDPYFHIGKCKLEFTDSNGAKQKAEEYCRYPVRSDYTFEEGHPKQGQIAKYDCNAGPPSLADHPQNTDIKYCCDIDAATCESKILDPDCYKAGGLSGDCNGETVKPTTKEECADNDCDWIDPVPTIAEWSMENPFPYYHDCANWDGVISTPGLDCDAVLPCTECCEGGSYISCASASSISSLSNPNGIPGSQIPNGKWINYHGGKSPEVFEVVYAEIDDDAVTAMGKLVVKKNSQTACGWAEGTVVSIGMADRNEAETGQYPGTTRDKLSRNPWTEQIIGSEARMKTKLTKSIPDGKKRWNVNTNKNSPEYGLPRDLTEYMEIFVKDPGMLFSRANLLEQDLYRKYERPISGFRTDEPWPYGDGLWPVGHQSNGKAPSAIADSSQLESIGHHFVRDARVGFLPTLSNINDENRAVFLSDLPKIETNYIDGDNTKPDFIYHNTFNMSLSIKEVENIYDRDASFCTNTNYEDQATCEALGRCELKTEIPDDGSPDFVPGRYKITITGNDEDACGKVHVLNDGSKKKDVWIKTAWWRPKFLYTKLTTFEEHDLSDGEKIILSGGQSVTATCEEVPGVHKTPAGNPMFEGIPDLPKGMDMSMVDQVLCEESLGGVWTYEEGDTDTIVGGCPPLCELDGLIGKATCNVTDCPDCFNLLETCLEKDTSATNPVWKENNNLSKNQCIGTKTILRKWRYDEDVCPRSAIDGGHVVQLLPDDKKSIIIIAENRSDIADGALNRASNFVDNTNCSHTIDVNGKVFVTTEKECNANQFTNHCYWRGGVIGGCIHQSQCDKLDDHGCKISPFCTYYPAILDDDGEQTEPGHCQEETTAFDPLTTLDLQNKTSGALPLVKMGHEVMLGSPKNLYKGEQYITPKQTKSFSEKENYGPYYGSKWSRHGGKFRIRVGQELPLNDCHQGDSSTPTMLHWLFTFPDEVCNHYLPIIDADCGDQCNRGYGPLTEEIHDKSRRFGFPAQGLLRIDVHESGGADSHLKGGPDRGTTYPE